MSTRRLRGYAAIGLYSPKCEANIGGALRAAGCYEASLVAICGHRYRRQSADTQATYRHIPLLHAANLMEVIPFDCVPIAVELHDKAKSLHKYTHPERAFYIFGPEDGSIPLEIQQRCRDWIQIPTKYCMNLAATVNVVLYDRLAKLQKLAGVDGR